MQKINERNEEINETRENKIVRCEHFDRFIFYYARSFLSHSHSLLVRHTHHTCPHRSMADVRCFHVVWFAFSTLFSRFFHLIATNDTTQFPFRFSFVVDWPKIHINLCTIFRQTFFSQHNGKFISNCIVTADYANWATGKTHIANSNLILNRKSMT